MTTQSRGYIAGLGNILTVCDRCGFTLRRSRTGKEWTNLRVCQSCIDPVPPQLSPPNIYPEGLPVQDARPLPTYVFVTPGPIDPSAL